MKKIVGEYAYPIIIVIGLCLLILISWFYSSLNIDDTSAFWISVLPSAFVDVISLVISTILITKIIDRKKAHNEKSKLYKILKTPHKKLIDYILLEYLYVIMNKHANYFTKEPPENNFRVDNIEPYFRENVHRNFQKDVIVFEKSYPEYDESGEITGHVEDKNVMRSTLMYEYQKNVERVINKYISDYSPILNADYLVILVEIKEILNSNPFGVYKYSKDGEINPITIINIEKYIQKNQNYLDGVLKLVRFFSDIDVQAAWNGKEKNEWGVIGVIFGIAFFTYLLIRIGEFLISL